MTEFSIEQRKEPTAQEQTRSGRSYVPKVDIVETEQGLYLWADLPGVDEGSIDVRLEEGELSIEGRVGVEEYRDLTPVYTEYNIGNFVRSFRLSDQIDVSRIRAKMNNGVLELELPKAEKAKPRRIEVRSV